MANPSQDLKPLEPGHFAARLGIALDPEAARELDQAAERLHQDLQPLRTIPLQGTEPPVAFQPGEGRR